MKNLAIGRKALNYYKVVINTRARFLKDGYVYPKIKPKFKHGFLVQEHITQACKTLESLYSEIQ